MLQSAELSRRNCVIPWRHSISYNASAEDLNKRRRGCVHSLGSTLDQWGTVHDVLADVVDRIGDDERRDVQLTLGRILYEELNAPDDALLDIILYSKMSLTMRWYWRRLRRLARLIGGMICSMLESNLRLLTMRPRV